MILFRRAFLFTGDGISYLLSFFLNLPRKFPSFGFIFICYPQDYRRKADNVSVMLAAPTSLYVDLKPSSRNILQFFGVGRVFMSLGAF